MKKICTFRFSQNFFVIIIISFFYPFFRYPFDITLIQSLHTVPFIRKNKACPDPTGHSFIYDPGNLGYFHSRQYSSWICIDFLGFICSGKFLDSYVHISGYYMAGNGKSVCKSSVNACHCQDTAAQSDHPCLNFSFHDLSPVLSDPILIMCPGTLIIFKRRCLYRFLINLNFKILQILQILFFYF